MDIEIYHQTVYRYEEPASYSIQSLRMTPQTCDGQVVRYWSLQSALGSMHAFTDSFGNVTHTLVIDQPHDEVKVLVKGNVLTTNTNGVVSGTNEPFPDSFYLRETYQTKADGAIVALARSIKGDSEDVLEILHKLMQAIRDSIDYKLDQTDVLTTASEALAKGAGVCQDHAHVFIACARSLQIPARYVSGYLMNAETGNKSEASHAWAEALVPGLGWVAFDVANNICASEHYVRIGVGLDYQEASPICGSTKGGSNEKMSVLVQVSLANVSAQ